MGKTWRINPDPKHPYSPHEVAFRNCALNSSNNLVVRPAYRSLKEADEGTEYVFGFSLKTPNTGEMTHYVGVRNITTNVITLHLFDEQLQSKTSLEIGVVADRRVIANAAVIVSPQTSSLEILITSPQFNALYGLLGGGITAAQKVASINPDTTAIDIPRGLCIGIDGRALIADGRQLFISDAKKPRTFTFINASGLDGQIYGLHALPQGNLAIVTDKQTYLLPSDAFFTGQQVLGIFQPLADYRATDYLQTAVVDGHLFGLSRYGIRDITNDLAELSVDDPVLPRRLVEPLPENDFRGWKMFEGERGPVICQDYGRHVCDFDVERGFFNWHEVADGYEMNVVGTLTEKEGHNLIITPEHILRQFGNTEFTGQDVWGTFMGKLETPPTFSYVIREVTTASDSLGSQKVSVRGEATKTLATPQIGIVIGINTWGDSTNLETPAFRSRKSNWNVRSDEITVEVSHQYPGSRIYKVELEEKTVGKRRTSR